MDKKTNQAQLAQIEELIKNADVGEQAHKEHVFNRVMHNLAAGEHSSKRQKKEVRVRLPRFIAVAVCSFLIVCSIAAFSSTAFAQNIIHKVLAHFQIGNFEIVQYDGGLPDETVGKRPPASRSKEIVQLVSLKEARAAIGNFAVPAWIPKGYAYVGCLLYDDQMATVQYRADGGQFSLQITNQKKTEPNGALTTDDIDTEVIDGKTVYFVNGIVMWNMNDLLYELYWADYDMDSVSRIISSLEEAK